MREEKKILIMLLESTEKSGSIKKSMYRYNMVVSLVAILIIVFLTPIERSLTLLEVIPVSLMVSILCLSLINYLDCKRRYEFKVKEIKFRLNELDRLEQELD